MKFPMKFPINLVLDTNIFNNNKYSFETAAFYRTLKQLINQNKIKLYMSRVVLEEVRAHIYSELLEEIETVYNRINKLQRCFPKTIVDSFGLPEKPAPNKEQTDLYLDSFVSDLNAEIMEYDNLTIETIFNDYFEMKPPFEEKKKEEFPDSVIYHQIINNFSCDKTVFVLCKDGGLYDALDKLPYCQPYKDHNILFDCISQQYEGYEQAMKEIQEQLTTFTSFFKQHESGILRQLKVSIKLPNRFDPDYSVDYDIDTGNISIIDDKKPPIRIIDFDNQTISTLIYLKFDATIYFHYNFIGLYKEECQVHKSGCWVDFVWNRKNKSVEKCNMDYTFRFPTLVSRAREDAEIIGLCPDCGKSITIHNDGGNGFCINCAQFH